MSPTCPGQPAITLGFTLIDAKRRSLILFILFCHHPVPGLWQRLRKKPPGGHSGRFELSFSCHSQQHNLTFCTTGVTNLCHAFGKGCRRTPQAAIQVPVSSQVDVVQLVCISHGHVGTAGKQAVQCPGSKGVVLNGEVQAQVCCIALIPGKKRRYLLGRRVSICCEEEAVSLGV